MEKCLHCDEEIGEADAKYPILEARLAKTGSMESRTRWLHRECMIREVVGGMAHQLGLCSCNGGIGLDVDPPGVTKRQAALMAVRVFESQKFVDALRNAPGAPDTRVWN